MPGTFSGDEVTVLKKGNLHYGGGGGIGNKHITI